MNLRVKGFFINVYAQATFVKEKKIIVPQIFNRKQTSKKEMASLPRNLIFSCNMLNKNCISFREGYALSNLGDFANELNYKGCNKMEVAKHLA